MRRRSFLAASGATLGASLTPGFWRAAGAEPARPGDGPYGSIADRSADRLGIVLPEGFTARELARSGHQVGRTGYEWHTFPDGGATFALDGGGWAYASNSEVDAGGGGVGVLRFDADGEVVDAYRILADTSRNCAGGPTPWGTWLSCEETDDGQVWEADPSKPGQGTAHPAMGAFRHEAAAVDPGRKVVYLTEDHPDGRFYRFTPDAYPDLSAGTLEVAEVDGEDGAGRVTWHEVEPSGSPTPTRAQGKGTPYSGGEGIWFAAGEVYFTTKGDDHVRAYDAEADTIEVIYDASKVRDAPLTGVDNITRGAGGDLFVCEDGGNMELVLITPEREVAPFLRVEGQDDSELTGVAFSPDGRHLYVSSQRGGGGAGITYAVTGPFRGAGGAAGGGSAKTSTTLAAAGDEGRDLLVGGDGGDDDLTTALVIGGVSGAALVAIGAVGTLKRRQRLAFEREHGIAPGAGDGGGPDRR